MTELERAETIFFQSIAHLSIDLALFLFTPRVLWTKFFKLEALSIGFFPFDLISSDSISRHTRKLSHDHREQRYRRVKAGSNTIFGERAEWVRNLAVDILQEISCQHPTWKVPRVEIEVITILNKHRPSKEEVNGWDDIASGKCSRVPHLTLDVH